MKKASKLVKRMFKDLTEMKEKSQDNQYVTPFQKDIEKLRKDVSSVNTKVCGWTLLTWKAR